MPFRDAEKKVLRDGMRPLLAVCGFMSLAFALFVVGIAVLLFIIRRIRGDRLRALIEREARTVLSHVTLPPPGTKGVVMCAGGRYLGEAFASITMLRASGSKLPVCIVHAGPEEVEEVHRHIFRKAFGDSVFFKDATTFDLGVRPHKLQGFEIKPYALLLSPFQHTLLLDADCSTVGPDPASLFKEHAYREYGNIFWPDFAVSNELVRPWMIGTYVKTQVSSGFETESGQIVVNVQRCIRGLVYSWLLNKHSDVFYSCYYGDKDLFRIGWLMAGLPFYQVPWSPGLVGNEDDTYGIYLNSMIQKHPCHGTPLFAHRTMHKRLTHTPEWTVYVPNDGELGTRTTLRWPEFNHGSCLDGLRWQLRPSPPAWVRMGRAIREAEETFAARSESPELLLPKH